MRPKITEQRICNASQAFCPGFQTWDVINADAQNLDIRFREPGVFGLVGRNLARSDRRPGQGEEGQDGGRAAQVAEAHLFVQMAAQLEIRRFVSNF